MSFGLFKLKVQTWATERGIYEHSTPLAQALKAVSEIGEVADAVIKDDHDALKDGIGDTVVCLVNLAFMSGIDIHHKQTFGLQRPADAAAAAAAMVGLSAVHAVEPSQPIHMDQAISSALEALDGLARAVDLEFMDCCDAAWKEIKDRKGQMVAGGAFVKDEEPLA